VIIAITSPAAPSSAAMKGAAQMTFDTVDDKLAEAEFFLRKMADSGTDGFAFGCYLSAFLSAARTTTLALQRFSQVIPGFPEWYEHHSERLKVNETARFMLDTRNDHIHGGPYPISAMRISRNSATYEFASTRGYEPAEDVLTTCRDHFIILLEIVYDCYVALGFHIDPQQYFTKEHYPGGSIDAAETEVYGWVCESLVEEGFDEDARWHELRGRVEECKINHLFFSYLGRITPQPVEPDEYEDFAFTPEEKGWIHAPAGFNSPEEYNRYVAARNAGA
jgi:hypothetical protein